MPKAEVEKNEGTLPSHILGGGSLGRYEVLFVQHGEGRVDRSVQAFVGGAESRIGQRFRTAEQRARDDVHAGRMKLESRFIRLSKDSKPRSSQWPRPSQHRSKALLVSWPVSVGAAPSWPCPMQLGKRSQQDDPIQPMTLLFAHRLTLAPLAPQKPNSSEACGARRRRRCIRLAQSQLGLRSLHGASSQERCAAGQKEPTGRPDPAYDASFRTPSDTRPPCTSSRVLLRSNGSLTRSRRVERDDGGGAFDSRRVNLAWAAAGVPRGERAPVSQQGERDGLTMAWQGLFLTECEG
jgi:hypothetical protein